MSRGNEKGPEDISDDYTPNSRRCTDQTSNIGSPKPCVTYRG